MVSVPEPARRSRWYRRKFDWALDIQHHSGLDQMEEALRGRRLSVTGDGSTMRV